MAAQLHSVIPKLPAVDLQATKSFYVEKLNFRQVGGDYPDYLMLFRDEIELDFFVDCDLDVNRNDGMCYVRVSAIEDLYDSLNKIPSDNYIGKLEPRPWGQKEFSIKDVNGNMLTFGEVI